MQRVGLGDRGDVDDEVAVFPDVDEGVFEGESVGAGLQGDRQYRREPPDDGEERDGVDDHHVLVSVSGVERFRGQTASREDDAVGVVWMPTTRHPWSLRAISKCTAMRSIS